MMEAEGISYRGYLLTATPEDGGWLVRIVRPASDLRASMTVKEFPAGVSRDEAIAEVKRLVDALVLSEHH